MKKFIIVIVVIISISLIATGTYLSINSKTNSKENVEFSSQQTYELPEKDRLSIKNCKTSECHIKEIDYYDKLVIKNSNKVLDKKISKINNDTKKYYEKANSSTTNGPNCVNVKDLYYHEFRTTTVYYPYENEKYISVAVQREHINTCNNSYEKQKIEWYLYDKDSKKLLTQEQFKEKEGITESAITLVINNTIQQINKDESKNIQPKDNYEDTIVFYDYQGNILVSFYIPELNTYRDAIVRVNVEKES